MEFSCGCLKNVLLYFSVIIQASSYQFGYLTPPTTTTDYDYYEAYFSGTVSILAPNNWHKSGFVPQLVSHGRNFKLEPGETLVMKCLFQDLSEDFLPHIVWRKLDRKNSLIAEGDKIVNVDFVKKTTVTVNRNGSTFAMAPITHSDAGLYQCSLSKDTYKETLVHHVEVIISPELETRNINWQLARSSAGGLVRGQILYVLVVGLYFYNTLSSLAMWALHFHWPGAMVLSIKSLFQSDV